MERASGMLSSNRQLRSRDAIEPANYVPWIIGAF